MRATTRWQDKENYSVRWPADRAGRPARRRAARARPAVVPAGGSRGPLCSCAAGCGGGPPRGARRRRARAASRFTGRTEPAEGGLELARLPQLCARFTSHATALASMRAGFVQLGLLCAAALCGGASALACQAQLPVLRDGSLPEALAALQACAAALPRDWAERNPYALVEVVNALVPPLPPPDGHSAASLIKESLFPESSLLEESWTAIAAEAEAVLASRAVPEFAYVDPNQEKVYGNAGGWKLFILRLMGADLPSHAAACPRTSALLRRAGPEIRSAFFSVLAPGTSLARHQGPSRAVLRYQLGLVVPQPDACELRVESASANCSASGGCGDDVYHWREGEGVIWDDTRWHSARNDGTLPRVVLFLDIRRRGDVEPRVRALDEAALALLQATPAFAAALRRAEAPTSDGGGGSAGFELR